MVKRVFFEVKEDVGSVFLKLCLEQETVGPKSSLLKQMGKHSRKPLKALVKTFGKEL